MGVFGEGEAAGMICAQRLPMTRRHGQTALGVESDK